MVLEAVQLATQEQMVDAAKHQKLIDAGDVASSPAAMEHAKHGLEFSNEVEECLQLITTEPENHYDICFTGLNWRSGRAFLPYLQHRYPPRTDAQQDSGPAAAGRLHCNKCSSF